MAAILGSQQALNLSSVRLLAVLPILTAALAVAVVLRPAARRLVWPAAVLAAANVVLTPFTSGEWFYQRAEDASYDQAVARGDFGGFDRMMGQHDPHLLPRMTALAVALLAALVVVALLRDRAGPARGIADAAVLLAAAASAVQGVLLLV
jgi:lysylphosphatidylglycerol synthetase-like protein (DUF2156 family)